MDTCTEFLQRVLPRIGLRWRGYRKIRRQVCRRIVSRISELGFSGFHAYEMYLEQNSEELRIMEEMCQVTISRFYRDRDVWEYLRDKVLPSLAAEAIRDGRRTVEALCVGAASGEEPYTLSLVWQNGIRANQTYPRLRITAIEASAGMINRAKAGVYSDSSVKELPEDLKRHFLTGQGTWTISTNHKRNIIWVHGDIRRFVPDHAFDIIFCRNLVFTYFEESLQADVISELRPALPPGGFLVLGKREHLPEAVQGLFDPTGNRCVFRFRRQVEDDS